MANIIEGLFHTIQVNLSVLPTGVSPVRHRRANHASQADPQGIFQSILAVIQAFFNVIYSVFHGIFSLVWGVVESLANFVGASAHFVACESTEYTRRRS